MIAGLGRKVDGASAASPGAPAQIPYQEPDRKADLRRGQLDGRRRSPSYTQISDRITADGWFTTAYSEELQELGRTRMHDELNAYQQLVAPKHRMIASLRERLVTTAEEIARTDIELRETASELTPEELVPRSPMEAQRGADFVRSRRRSMRTRQAQKARERIVGLNGDTAEIRRQVAEACTEVEQDLERARTRIQLQAAHTELRVMTYWDAVTETHPEGRQLTVVRPRIRLEFPAWPAGVPTGTDDEGPAPGAGEG